MIALSSRACRCAAAALFCAVLLPAHAWAQAGDEAFKRGLEARDKKNWKLAETEMRAAIERAPTEGARKVGGLFGLGSTEYLPHYFLGEALFQQGNCVGAVTEWGISEQQRVVRTKRDFADTIKKGYDTCAAKGVLPPAEFTAQQAAATKAVDEGYAYADRVTRSNADAWRQDLRDQYNRIREDLNNSRRSLDNGTRTRSAAEFEAARTTALRATSALQKFEVALNTSIATLTAVGQQTPIVEQKIGEADAAEREIDGLNTTLSQQLASQRQQARDLLKTAREQLRTGQRTQSLTTVNDALRSAQDAATLFQQVLSEAKKVAQAALERELGEAGSAAAEALSFLDSSLVTLDKLFTEKAAAVTPDEQSQRETLQKRVAAIRRRVEAARTSQNVKGLKDAARAAADARTDLDKLVAAFGPVSLRDRGVQAALEDGARQFFAGDYQQALNTLSSGAIADAPLQIHVHLFRAAALYHLFIRSGEKDQTLKMRALEEVEACKRLNSQFTPDPRAFAPRFVTFYQNPSRSAP